MHDMVAAVDGTCAGVEAAMDIAGGLIDKAPTSHVHTCVHACATRECETPLTSFPNIDSSPFLDQDPASGLPSGILRERACELMVAVLGTKTIEEKKRFLMDGLALCSARGLTCVHTNDERCVAAYQALQAEGALDLRIFLTPMHDELAEMAMHRPCPPKALQTRWGKGGNEGDEGGLVCMSAYESMLVVNRVKIFCDGSLGAETAALRGAAAADGTSETGGVSDGEEKEKGLLIHSDDALVTKVVEAHAAGLRLEMHAIGDRAADQVLRALAGAHVPSSARPIMTHCQILGPDIVARMVSQGVVANVQPAFVPTDMKWVSERISAPQQLFAYAWRTLMTAGVVVAGGSDAPVEPCSPLLGMHDAILRRARPPLPLPLPPTNVAADVPADAEAETEAEAEAEAEAEVYRPSECLSFAQALWMYTVGGAYASGSEAVLGKIHVGYAGDLVFLDPAVLRDPALLREALPRAVVVGGRLVRGRAWVAGCNTDPVVPAVPTADRTERLTPGLFVPGRNGARPNRFRCACVLEGKGYLCAGL